jgi:hypothetical protein
MDLVESHQKTNTSDIATLTTYSNDDDKRIEDNSDDIKTINTSLGDVNKAMKAA